MLRIGYSSYITIVCKINVSERQYYNGNMRTITGLQFTRLFQSFSLIYVTATRLMRVDRSRRDRTIPFYRQPQLRNH